MAPPAETLVKNSMYIAAIVEEKINGYKGVMPQSERITLALNLWELLTLAKERKIQKGAIVVASGVSFNVEAPANALGNYCLAPKAKSQRMAKPRLYAHPQNYLKLACAAADLMRISRHEAIIKLAEGSNYFSVQEQIDEAIFSPTQAVWRLLKTRLAVIVERHQLKQYFRDAYEVSAVYGEDVFDPKCWKQDPIGPSTSYWPSVYLGAVIRSSASAHLTIEKIDAEVGGQVHAIEQVFLTLGWQPSGWVVAYLECLPGLAVQPFEGHPLLFDFHTSGETFTEGSIGSTRFVIDNGGSIKVPDGCRGDWPYRLRSRKRFESLTPHQLAMTLLECRLILTPNETLAQDIETKELLSPPDSPLALLEAQLLSRKGLGPSSRNSCFLDSLEEDIVYLKDSFQAWRRTNQEAAKRDHVAALTAAVMELEDLRSAAI